MKILNSIIIGMLIMAFFTYGVSAKSPKIKQCMLRVEGMDCDKCAATVKEALESIKGVKEVKVSLENKQALVKFENGVDLKSLTEAVNKKGFKATLKEEIIVLNIEGMHCEHCAKEVKDVLEKQSGVISADVNFPKKEAVVTCQPGKVSLEQLIETIESNTEYKASPKN